jgi:hypothetical protein
MFLVPVERPPITPCQKSKVWRKHCVSNWGSLSEFYCLYLCKITFRLPLVRLSGSKQALVYGTVRLSSDTLNAMIDTCTIPINIAIARLHANEILAKDETLRHRSPLYSYGGPILSPPRNSNSSACPGTSSSTHARRLGAPRPHGMQQKIRRRSRSHQRVLQQQELGKKRSPLHERSQLKTQDSSGD